MILMIIIIIIKIIKIIISPFQPGHFSTGSATVYIYSSEKWVYIKDILIGPSISILW